ncbi:MAG TPA: peptidyl-prolyl cis-trans isomerase [Caulobacteraceae bacterium]|nr:peptidyl-prolyl cis-trans isomerase [Caulobacteraceae bacterium]
MLVNASLSWRKAPLLTAAAVLCVLAACAPRPGSQRAPEPGDRAVAIVNGQTVWASDVKREAVAEGLIGAGDPLDPSSDVFRQVLDEVIDTKVLAGEALARKLDKDPVAQRRLAAARERALENLMVESVVGRAVNQRAENALYQEFLKSRTPGEVIHLRQIVVTAEPDAEAVKKQVGAGAAFEALALARSTDSATRFKGGDLGETTTDTLPPPIAEAVKGAKPGQVIGPVKVDAGWAILKVDDRHPEAPPTLDAVRPQLIRFITYDQIKDLVLTLRNKAKIQNLLPPPPEVAGAPAEPASAPPPGTTPAPAPPTSAPAPPAKAAPAKAAPVKR